MSLVESTSQFNFTPFNKTIYCDSNQILTKIMSPVATRSGAKPSADLNRGTKRASKSASDKPHKAPKTKSVKDEKPSQKKYSPAKNEKKTASKANVHSSDVPQILETGVINYFVRGKVDVEELKSVDDIARGYLVLRPISQDTDLTKRPLPNNLTSRLLALPKKELPQSTSDRFMAFVDEADMPYSKLVEGFLAPGKHETKTAGERHVPSATPVGEGVYAITSTGNESHLAYISSLPQSKDNLHKTLGFHEKGSFLISTKNPKRPGPAYARLPAPPKYPNR